MASRILIKFNLGRKTCQIRNILKPGFQIGSIVNLPFNVSGRNVLIKWNSTGKFNIRSKRIAKFKRLDSIPEEYQLVYFAPLHNYLTSAQVVCILSGCIIIVILTNIVITDGLIDFSKKKGFATLSSKNQLLICLFSLLGFIFSVQKFATRIPLRIYRKDNQYISVFNGFFASLSKIQLKFMAGECRKSRPIRFGLWNSCRFEINKKMVFLMDHNFKSNEDYNHMISSDS